jgi:hypothetical protein
MRALGLVIVVAACGSHRAQAPDVDASPPPMVDAAPDARTPGDPFQSIAQMPGLCTSAGWCWRWPTPTGNDIDNVFGTDPNNVWLTGWGFALQWDGYAWTQHHLPVLQGQGESQRLFAIGGNAANNMWVVYGTALEHWDGTSWSIIESQPLSGNPSYNTIWVSPDGDAWVTTSTGYLEHFSGTTKLPDIPICSCFLGKVWGTSRTDMYFTTVGSELHYDGNAVTTIHQGATLGGWQGTVGDVWVSGPGGMGHWDGTTFTTIALPAEITTQWISASGYNGASDVWWYVDGKGFLHWDGSQLTLTPAAGPSISFLSSQIIGGKWWITGRSGQLFTAMDPYTLVPVLDPNSWYTAMWGTGETDMYIANGDSLLHWDGNALTPLTSTLGIDTQYYAEITSITGQGQDVYVVTQEETVSNGTNSTYATVAYHFDGTAWSHQTIETGTRSQLVGMGVVEPLGPGEAWAFNALGTSWHFTGGSWQAVTTTLVGKPFTSAWAQDSTHVWIAGADRSLVTWDAATPGVFTSVSMPSSLCVGPEGEQMQLGQIIGVGGYPWIPSIESCRGVAAMWKLGSGGWTEELNHVLGNGSVLQINPETEAAHDQGGLVAISDQDLVFSASGNTSTWRYDGSVWNYEDTGSEYGTPIVFATPSGPTFISSRDHGILSHPAVTSAASLPLR